MRARPGRVCGRLLPAAGTGPLKADGARALSWWQGSRARGVGEREGGLTGLPLPHRPGQTPQLSKLEADGLERRGCLLDCGCRQDEVLGFEAWPGWPRTCLIAPERPLHAASMSLVTPARE